jgi:hypothetical protein
VAITWPVACEACSKKLDSGTGGVAINWRGHERRVAINWTGPERGVAINWTVAREACSYKFDSGTGSV